MKSTSAFSQQITRIEGTDSAESGAQIQETDENGDMDDLIAALRTLTSAQLQDILEKIQK
jgi:hypothetical protein